MNREISRNIKMISKVIFFVSTEYRNDSHVLKKLLIRTQEEVNLTQNSILLLFLAYKIVRLYFSEFSNFQALG